MRIPWNNCTVFPSEAAVERIPVCIKLKFPTASKFQTEQNKSVLYTQPKLIDSQLDSKKSSIYITSELLLPSGNPTWTHRKKKLIQIVRHFQISRKFVVFPKMTTRSLHNQFLFNAAWLKDLLTFHRNMLRKENLSLRRLIFFSGNCQFGVHMFKFFLKKAINVQTAQTLTTQHILTSQFWWKMKFTNQRSRETFEPWSHTLEKLSEKLHVSRKVVWKSRIEASPCHGV